MTCPRRKTRRILGTQCRSWRLLRRSSARGRPPLKAMPCRQRLATGAPPQQPAAQPMAHMGQHSPSAPERAPCSERPWQMSPRPSPQRPLWLSGWRMREHASAMRERLRARQRRRGPVLLRSRRSPRWFRRMWRHCAANEAPLWLTSGLCNLFCGRSRPWRRALTWGANGRTTE